MAEPTHNPLVGKQPGADDAAKNNADVAAKLADQDISGKSTVASKADIDDTSAALDALAAQVTKAPDADKPPADKPVVTPKATDDSAKAPDDSAKAPDAPAKAPDDATKPAPAAPAVDPTVQKKVDDIFKDTPSLPAGASPKSAEAFATVKVKAAQEISARDSEIAKLQKQVSEYEATKGKPTPEQEAMKKELEDLRMWRAKLDVDFDPKFKEHDKSIEQAREFVYAQLTKHSQIVTPEVVAEIKKFGGPDNTDLSKVFEAIKDPVLQRLVEAKLADIEMLKYNKQQAIQSAKSNVGEWMKKREDEWKQAATQHTHQTRAYLDPMLGALDWFKDKKAEDNADEAAKKGVEEHNKFVGELKGQIQAAMQDDSPQMRAILVTGMAQLFNLQREHAQVKNELASAKKALEEVTSKYERVKSASVSRLRESSAPDNATPAPAKTSVATSTGDALDALARQVMEQRAAAANR